MGEHVTQLTVRQVIKDVVAETAPEELPLLAGLEPLDDTAIDRVLGQRARTREPLGFGLDTVVALVTPVLWTVLSDVARQELQTAASGGLARLKQRLRRHRRPRQDEAALTLPPLDRVQAQHVRELVLARCTAAGIDDTRAAAIADGVTVRLLLDEPRS
ncbi:hypothetical protein [Streptomyces sp. NPDC020742]|uniref:hypothetical protein n=1 Tax=Streptomyces sp. NPDC020742 TaxID=3154897 RepID=UPI0033EC80FF